MGSGWLLRSIICLNRTKKNKSNRGNVSKKTLFYSLFFLVVNDFKDVFIRYFLKHQTVSNRLNQALLPLSLPQKSLLFAFKRLFEHSRLVIFHYLKTGLPLHFYLTLLRIFCRREKDYAAWRARGDLMRWSKAIQWRIKLRLHSMWFILGAIYRVRSGQDVCIWWHKVDSSTKD